MDIKSFNRALNQVAQERGILPEKVIETIEAAIAAAYKKDYGKKGQRIVAKFNPVTGDVKFWQQKLVVDESMIYSEEELEKLKESQIRTPETEETGKKVVFNPEKNILIEEAKKINPKIKLGEELEISLEAKEDYGRIAAQTAKQVILQKIREAEKETIYNEFKAKEGEIISGIVQRMEKTTVFVDIGRTLGVLTKEEQIPGESYRLGQRMKFYVLKIEESQKGPIVLLSRAYPKLISKLFELEVPEIATGQVIIRSIAREPGFRTKIAVVSTEEGVDPIGSCVGQRGTRIMVVINELGGEKIDVVEWQKDPEKFIANSLSPAKVIEVKIEGKNTAKVFVPEDQLSLAIGKDGRNVRLAANLTGWKIDIKSVGTTEETKEEEKIEKDEEGAGEKGEDKKPARNASPARNAVSTAGWHSDAGGENKKKPNKK